MRDHTDSCPATALPLRVRDALAPEAVPTRAPIEVLRSVTVTLVFLMEALSLEAETTFFTVSAGGGSVAQRTLAEVLSEAGALLAAAEGR